MDDRPVFIYAATYAHRANALADYDANSKELGRELEEAEKEAATK
jgi:PHD/YefM family antitoxin component YafN of YafNO toxin-antitoxin module